MIRLKEDIKIEHFADNYIKNGMNGTQAYKSIVPTASNEVAAVQSSKLLRKDKTQKSIADRMPTDSILSNVIKTNITGKPVDKLNHDMQFKYVNLALKLKGYLNDTHNTQVNVGLFTSKD